MSDNQTTDAASLLDAVKRNQSAVRVYTEKGGLVDFMALVAAQGLGTFADPGRVDYSTPRLITAAIALFAFVPTVLVYMRRRHNFGGTVGLLTWLGAGAVFVANIVAFHAAHGDARELIRSLTLGVALLAVGAVYRSAPLVLLGGAMTIAVPGSTLGWPLVTWLAPLVVWIAAVGFVFREQLAERVR
jgi:hypothetical protein